MRSFFAAAVALGLLILCSGCATSSLSSRASDLSTDEWLKSEIYNRIQADAEFNPTALGIEVKDGVVTLYGKVWNPSERVRALAIVQNTTGVKRVIDRMVQ